MKKGKNNYFTYILCVLLGAFIWNSVVHSSILNLKSKSPALTPTPSPIVACDEYNSIDKAKKSVVRIISDIGEGTGFVIDKAGYVVTNYHVVQGSNIVKVMFPDNTSVAGTVFNWDQKVDLAIIKIDTQNLYPLQFGNSDNLIQGKTLYALGYPLGQDIPGDITISKATFSAQRDTKLPGLKYIQIDANLNPGNSGSPIIDPCGYVMGIDTFSIKDTEGLRFAISSKTAYPLSKSLITSGQRPLTENKTVSSEVDTIILYFNYISTRQLDYAYDLLSLNFKNKLSKDAFKKGYDNTLNVYVQEVKLVDPNIPSVYVKFSAAEYVNRNLQFTNYEGDDNLVDENGLWKIDSSSIQAIQ